MDLHKLAVIAAMGMGVSFAENSGGRSYREAQPTLPPVPPKLLTKRQKRRLRGKRKGQPWNDARERLEALTTTRTRANDCVVVNVADLRTVLHALSGDVTAEMLEAACDIAAWRGDEWIHADKLPEIYLAMREAALLERGRK